MQEVVTKKGSFEYLRVSVTDRCNLRCIYCMPAEGIKKVGHDQILRYEEIIEVIKAAVSEGVFRVRITGGEPLTRKGVHNLIKDVAQIPEITDLSMTTNGLLLPENARQLRDAGLMRINISLDSLDSKKYSEISRGGSLSKVLMGIDEAVKLGFDPVKINVVVLPGFNDNEVFSFASLAYEKRLHVRFIERMPFAAGEAGAKFIPAGALLEELKQKFELHLEPRVPGGGPAEMYSLKSGKGKVGFISPMSNPFCASCNRLRLTATGTLRPCLDSEFGISIRNLPVQEIKSVITQLSQHKHKSAKPCAQFQTARCVSLSDLGG